MKIKALHIAAVIAISLMLLVSASPALAEEYYSIQPGELWYDNNGGHIQAHGGCVIWDEATQKYYFYGEARKTSIRPSDIGWLWDANQRIGVSCYSSTDLYNWTYEGLALKVLNYYTDSYPESDIQPYKVIERPKVIYNDKTGKYVMWMHVDSTDYGYARAGVAVSDSPTGPFKYVASYRPNGKMARDMTLFKDDDGTAYLYASGDNNMTMYCHRLTEDYLGFDGTYAKMFENWQREAPAVFKYQNRYFMVNSGCSGWDPNKADSAVAYNPMGPWYSKGNPCVGSNADYTFGGQSCYVFPVDKANGKFIFMADIWRPNNHSDSRYIWLPIEFTGYETFKIEWKSSWSVKGWVEETCLDEVPNLTLKPGDVYRTRINSSTGETPRIVSLKGDTDSIKTVIEGDELIVTALNAGKVNVTVRVGGGGYDGAATSFTVEATASGARAYFEKDGVVMINAKDALKDDETAFNSRRDYHYWSETESGLEILPDRGGEWRDTEKISLAPALYYRVFITNPGDYYVSLNTSHPNISGNSLHIGVNGEYLFTSTGEDNVGEGMWLVDDTLKISFPEAGAYIINIWGREDGSAINKICLSKEKTDDFDSLPPSKTAFAAQSTAYLSGSERIALDLKYNEGVGSILKDDISFVSHFGTRVTWQGGDFVTKDGAVIRPERGEPDEYITLTAVYEAEGETLRKDYKVLVPAKSDVFTAAESFDTTPIGSVREKSCISFDLAASAVSDGMVAFCSSDAKPSGWGDYPITVRICPDGLFDARNGGEYAKTEEIAYKTDITYHVLMEVDVTNQTYSVYVTDDEGNTGTVAKDFKFRFEADEIGRVTVRAGNYYSGGLFSVKNIIVSDRSVRVFGVRADEAAATGTVMYYDDEPAKLYTAFYSGEGELIALDTALLSEKGVKLISAEMPEETKKVRMMVRPEDCVTPIAESMAEYKRGAVFESAVSSYQDENAFISLPARTEAAVYEFSFTDNASIDSGVILGDSLSLNTSSRNYFASGSIVILFAGGEIYTRDDSAKTKAAGYTVGEEVKIRIEAGVLSNTYSLYVNGALAAENVHFRAAAEKIDMLALVENKGGEIFEVNNFTVK